MYAGNTVSKPNLPGDINRGLKLATNFKAGAAASNPSLLNREQVAVGTLKIHGYAIAGIYPCRPLYFSSM